MSLRLFGALFSATLAGGCSTLAADLDDVQACKGDFSADRDLQIAFTDTVDFREDVTVFRVVERDTEREGPEDIVFYGLIHGFNSGPNPEPSFRLHRVLRAGREYRVDVFVDRNDNHTPDSDEPSWAREICDHGVLPISLTAPTMALDATTSRLAGEDFTFDLFGMSSHVSGTQSYELRVREVEPVEDGEDENATSRDVGLDYRPDLNDSDFVVELPGTVFADHTYRVPHFVDNNQDGVYSFSGRTTDDHAWNDPTLGVENPLTMDEERRTVYTATEDGLHEGFQHNISFTDVGF